MDFGLIVNYQLSIIMKPLYDLQQELNRLFIAGSKFAKNDPRLQKHVPILKKLGEKAPVFNKLAQ